MNRAGNRHMNGNRHMKMARLVLLTTAFALLAGCGYRAPLTRLDPALQGEARKKARTAEKEAIARGLTVGAEARPVRVDDLTVRLEERPADPFNLPPEGSRKAKAIPFPTVPGAPPPPTGPEPHR